MTEGKFFKKPSVTADIIVPYEGNNGILLVERKRDPYKGYWAIPGGFLDVDCETVAEAAKRELYEETNLRVRLDDLVLIGETSNPNRDPRGHIVSLIYVATKYSGIAQAADDAADARKFSLENLPQLAFDHDVMIEKYIQWRNSK